MPVANANPCPDRETLEQFLLGELDGTAADTVENHLSTCSVCDSRLASIPADDPLSSIVGRKSAVLEAVSSEQLEELLDYLLSGPVPSFEAEPDSERVELLDPPKKPDEIGRIGPYRVLRELGRGGMGVVYLAEDTRLPRTVALKIVKGSRLDDPHYRERFRLEADAMARLQHPNIVPVYEAGDYRGRPFLALEFVAGGTLANHLQGRPQPPAAAAALIATLAEAVSFAHEQGILHRDLKPGNILLGDDERSTSREGHFSLKPKIVDFGLARHLDEKGLTQTGDLLGTPAYMAPELTRGGQQSTKDSPTVDVYSLGAILYECLTGRAPFGGETIPDTFEQVRTLDPVPPRQLQPKVPRDLETICLKCMAKEPSKRYSTARELADDLHRFREGRPIVARPAGAIEKLAKWARRKPAWATLFGALIVVGVVLTVVAIRYERKLRRAVDTAEANAAEAGREREHARASYREARAALEKMLARTADRRHGDLPRVRELQKDLQEVALKFYLIIAAQSGDPDREIRWDAAQARMEASLLQINLGRYDEARANLRLAAKQFRELSEADADNPRYRRAYAGALNRLGTITPDDEGLKLLQQGLNEVEALHGKDPSEQTFRNDIAQFCHALGQKQLDARNIEEADRYFSRAIDVRRGLLAEQPDWRDQQLAIGQTLGNLLNTRQVAKRPYSETQPIMEEACKMLEAASDADRSDPVALIALANLRNNWAYTQMARGEAETAISDLASPIEKLETFRLREPNWAEAQRILFACHGTRANAFDRLGKHAEAARDYRRVVESSPTDQARKHYRIELTALLMKAKDYSGAADEMDRVAGDSIPLVSSWHLKEHLRYCATLSHFVRWGIQTYKARANRAALAVLLATRKVISAENWSTWLAEARQVTEVAEFLKLPEFQTALQ